MSASDKDPYREPLLAVRDLQVQFKVRNSGWPWTPARALRAVNGVSFDLYAGETLGIVGESGCGKSTLARALLNLVAPSAGSIRWMGRDMPTGDARAWMDVRKQVQMVFQDPLGSLNPRMNIGQIVGEPLRTHQPTLPTTEVRQRVKNMLLRVGLDESHMARYRQIR